MLSHLFKLIWNKKKQNFLLIVEMLVSFAVLFAVFTLVVFYYNNYKKDAGFKYENVWTVSYTVPSGINRNDSVMMSIEALRNIISSMPQVKLLSFSGNNVPFSMNQFNSMLSYKNKQALSDFYLGERSYKDVLDLQLVKGSWYSRDMITSRTKPVVINETLKENLFGNEDPIGKIISSDPEKFKVVGVVHDFKSKGDYQDAGNGLFRVLDSADYKNQNSILIKVDPDANAAFEAKLYKTLSNFSKNANTEIEHLDKKLVSKNKVTLVPMLILLIVASFLIINVALGLFGVLWYNINKRRGEIGLRRAIGASGNSISKQLVGEALVLATLSLIIGSFFAIQFPLLNVFDLPAHIYITALLLSIAFIYLLVTICALYPGKQAAAIYPAVALHEE
ncbi:ABC transporter permease [Rubrolithibacter danxiaensis]|uniref:ABC transporter permease n=1 Tax=Rubrolithibacter danxiaensis TaxID=3390805 RepID=UPI003BF8E3DE